MSQVWLITGSFRGLGRVFTEAILAAGHCVLAAARNPDQLADLRSRYGDKIHTASLDVTSEAQAKDAVEAAVAKFGGLDVLVNNAGYGNVLSCGEYAARRFPRSNRDQSFWCHHYD